MRIFENSDYEKYILGCMILKNETIDMIKGKVQEDYFKNSTYRYLYKVILEQWKLNECVTLPSLANQCKHISIGELSAIPDIVTSTSDWQFYADELKKMWLASQLPMRLNELTSNVEPKNVIESLQTIDSEITRLMEYDTGKPVELKNVAEDFIKDVIKCSEMESEYIGVDTGFKGLNDILDGLEMGKLVLLGARPSMGKTALETQIATYLAEKGVPTCVFSLEMSAKALLTRILSQKTGIAIKNLKHGLFRFSESHLRKVNIAITNIVKAPFDIFDSAVDENKLISRIRIQAKTRGTKVFFVDHIGLVKYSNPNAKKHEALDDISQRLLHLAQELNVTIIALCQLKREAEGQKPTLSDLRDSGALEQNADICMFLHRDRATSINDSSIPAEIQVIKNRDGACGTANLKFLPQCTRFVEDTQDMA